MKEYQRGLNYSYSVVVVLLLIFLSFLLYSLFLKQHGKARHLKAYYCLSRYPLPFIHVIQKSASSMSASKKYSTPNIISNTARPMHYMENSKVNVLNSLYHFCLYNSSLQLQYNENLERPYQLRVNINDVVASFF